MEAENWSFWKFSCGGTVFSYNFALLVIQKEYSKIQMGDIV